MVDRGAGRVRPLDPPLVCEIFVIYPTWLFRKHRLTLIKHVQTIAINTANSILAVRLNPSVLFMSIFVNSSSRSILANSTTRMNYFLQQRQTFYIGTKDKCCENVCEKLAKPRGGRGS